MKYKNIFRVWVNRQGFQTIQCQVYPSEFSIITSILSQFPNISELEWFKDEVIKAKNTEGRTYAGQNTLELFVTGETTEIGHEFDKDNFVKVPTQIVFDFIDEAIAFHKLYESNQIPGLIPTSKKESWTSVPNEYVKDEYWELKKNIDSGET
jgi:hypothetical protein